MMATKYVPFAELSRSAACELLARARGWTTTPDDYWLPPGCKVEQIGNLEVVTGYKHANPPNPFDNLNDYGALREWADGEKIRVTGNNIQPNRIVAQWKPHGGVPPVESSPFEYLDYTAERHAVIEAVGRVLGLWS